METDERTVTEDVGIDSLQTGLLSLRVGEVIPRLKVKQVRRITNKNRDDNLSQVDYRYAIEDESGKVLIVNTWALWRQIAAIMREAGTTRVTLELTHPGVGVYSARLIN